MLLQPQTIAAGDALPEGTLARIAELPLKPVPVPLDGQYVFLRALEPERDAEALYARSNGGPIESGGAYLPACDADEVIWRYMSVGPFSTLESFTEYLHQWTAGAERGVYCVFDRATNTPIGVTGYMSNVPQFLKIELGGIWYSPIAQRTNANSEATYLLLRHAFELGYRRLEWKCDALNHRSRRAAERLGFTFEGIQQAHMIIKGRNRDTAWFRILEQEWSGVEAALQSRLYGKETE